MNMRGACTIVYISQFFDAIGVGHCAWATYFLTRKIICSKVSSSSSLIISHNLFSQPLIIYHHLINTAHGGRGGNRQGCR
jgi:hypothetical protein